MAYIALCLGLGSMLCALAWRAYSAIPSTLDTMSAAFAYEAAGILLLAAAVGETGRLLSYWAKRRNAEHAAGASLPNYRVLSEYQPTL